MGTSFRIISFCVAFAAFVGSRATLCAQLPHGIFRTAPDAVLEDCFFECIDRPVVAEFRLDTSDGGGRTLSAEVVDPLRPFPSIGPSVVSISTNDFVLPDERSVEFVGEYLPGYAFQWRFTQAASGEVFWSGLTAWTGGRLDLMTMSNVLLVPVPFLSGDYNGNGRVEQADLDLVLTSWGDPSPPIPFGWVQDLPEGLVGQAALDGVLLNWGNTLPETTSAGQVPEPAAWLLLLLAITPRAVRRGFIRGPQE